MLNLDAIRNFFATRPIIKAWLFGSYARGEEEDKSDVDILVEFDYRENIGLFQHAEMIIALEDLLQKKVDLVSAKAIYPEIKQFVDQEKVLIYERS